MKRLATTIGGLVLLLAGMQIGCWRTVVASESPDHEHAARIKEWCIPPDCGIKAEVSSGLLPSNVGQVSDGTIVFAHIAWSPDSARVGVFIVNGYGEDIRSAYDTRTREKMPFTAVEKLVRDSIQYSYSLTESDLLAYSGDPLVWAEKDETAHTRFRRTRQR